MLAEIEAAIVERLQPLQEQGIKVFAFPDNPNELGRPFTGGQILVGFKDENLSEPQGNVTTAHIIQSQTLQFELSLQLKNLRSHTGALPVMDAVRDLLTGFKPPNVTHPMYQTKGGFVDLDSKTGIWFYSMVFLCRRQYQKKLI
jgi:Gp37 protein